MANAKEKQIQSVSCYEDIPLIEQEAWSQWKTKKNWNKRRDKITRMKKLKVREIFCWDFEKNENSNYYQDPNSTYII